MRPRRAWPLVALIAAGFAPALVFVVWALKASWAAAGDVSISVHGWIAIAIAFVFTGLLGGGLMALAFWSARKGWDDIDRDS